MSEEMKLLPCPFCGSVDIQHETFGENSQGYQCQDCGIACRYSRHKSVTDDYLRAKWNRRAPAHADEPVARYAGVDMSRFTIEWLIEPDTTGMGQIEKLRTLAYKERVPVGTLFYAHPSAGIRSEWIAVSDRLPDNNFQSVLVYGSDHDGTHYWAASGFAFHDPAWRDKYSVTHWRPLPAPPAIRAIGEA